MSSMKWHPFCLSHNVLMHKKRNSIFNALDLRHFGIKPLMLTAVIDLYQHWFRLWLGACLAPSHYLNQMLTRLKPSGSETGIFQEN